MSHMEAEFFVYIKFYHVEFSHTKFTLCICICLIIFLVNDVVSLDEVHQLNLFSLNIFLEMVYMI